MQLIKHKDLKYPIRKFVNSKYYGTCYKIGCFSYKTKKELMKALRNGELDFYKR